MTQCTFYNIYDKPCPKTATYFYVTNHLKQPHARCIFHMPIGNLMLHQISEQQYLELKLRREL